MDSHQDGTVWSDGSILEAADLLQTGPGRQPYEWLAEDTQSGSNLDKQLLALHELTPEPDPSLLQQYFGGYEDFYGVEMPELDMAAFLAMEAWQGQAPAWNRRSYQRDETWQRDRDRWYPRKEQFPSWYKQPTSRDDPPYKAARAGKDLRTLLDFYFDTFNFQHNRFMLELALQKAGKPHKALLSKSTIAELQFDVEELKGLNRLAVVLERLQFNNCKMAPLDDAPGAGFKVQRRWVKRGGPSIDFDLSTLRFTNSGEFMLRKLPEVRSFFVKDDAYLDELFARCIVGPIDMAEAPNDKFIVVSLNCSGIRERSVPEESVQATENRIKRHILLYQPDIICIQGLDPWQGPVGFGLASSLMESGYHVAACGGEANQCSTVFYHELRFELLSSTKGQAVADLKFLQAEAPNLRIACIQAEVPPQMDLEKVVNEAKALVLVADCLPIGGTEVLHMVQELAELRSAYRELGKEEVYTPVAKWDPVANCQRPVQTGASGLLKLHRPDCILYGGGVDVIATLAGHSPMYLTTLDAEEASSQFPTLRMPLLSVFKWKQD